MIEALLIWALGVPAIVYHGWYIITSIADWYTTKRRFVDQNLKWKEKHPDSDEYPYKEMNPILRLLFGEPSKDDEWKFAIFKIAIYAWMIWKHSHPLAYILWGCFYALLATNNKWMWLPKLIKWVKSKF